MSAAGGAYGGPEAPGGGQVPAPALPPSYEPYRALRGLAAWTAGLLIATAVAVGVVFVAELAGVSELSPDSGETAADATGAQVLIGALLGLIEGGIYIAAAVLFMIWLHRAYKNLRPLGVSHLRYGTGWAIGGWFVPVFNYIRPKQIVNDVWRGSDPEAPAQQDHRWRGVALPGLYRSWWAAWVGVAIFSLAAAVLLVAEGGGTVVTEVLYACTYLLTIAAALLASLAVRRTSERQESRARKLGWIRA